MREPLALIWENLRSLSLQIDKVFFFNLMQNEFQEAQKQAEGRNHKEGSCGYRHPEPVLLRMVQSNPD